MKTGVKDMLKKPILGFSSSFAFLVIMLLALWKISTPVFFGFVALIVIVLLINYYNEQHEYKFVIKGMTYALLLITFMFVFRAIQINFTVDRWWDFFCFYLDGQVAARGLNFYDPANYNEVFHQLTIPFQVDDTFREEILEVGFKYPPPTILLFYWLGFFSYETAHVLWMSIMLLVVFFAAYLIWKTFSKKRNIHDLILILCIVVVLPSSRNTFAFEQTTFYLLLFTGLFFRDLGNYKCGIWYGLGIFIKPIFALTGILLILPFRKNALSAALFTVTIVCFITFLIIGKDTFFTYFSNNPNVNVPPWQFTEEVNQSLLAEITRLTGYDFTGAPVFFNIWFIIAACCLSILTIGGYLQSYKIDVKLAYSLIIIYALLIYPATQNSYHTITIPIILYLAYEYVFTRYKYIIPVSLAVLIGLMRISAFIFSLGLWLLIEIIILFLITQRKNVIIQKTSKLNPV